MATFGPKAWVNPFGKTSIFSLFELLVFGLERRFFLFQNIVKDIFLAYIALKKKGGKIVIFGPKPWVNPQGLKKCQFLDFFVLLFFIALKGVFSLQNIVRDIFLCYIAQKKKMEKWPFLVLNDGLTPFEKCQFFYFLNVFFLQPEKAFFRCRKS